MTTKSKQASPTQESDEQLDEILEACVVRALESTAAKFSGAISDEEYEVAMESNVQARKRALLAWRDQEVVKERAMIEGDIAYVIGYARGLGHPCEYLEKRYPNLTTKEEQINE